MAKQKPMKRPEYRLAITLDPKHLAFVERGAEASGITVEKWVNNLLRLAKKSIPQLAEMAGLLPKKDEAFSYGLDRIAGVSHEKALNKAGVNHADN